MISIEVWKAWARQLKTDTYALYLAYRHPCTPWYARIWVACVVAYALSPIDLIPDFVPVVGYLDDLILVPLGIALAIGMIPDAVMVECREQARLTAASAKPIGRVGAAAIAVVWLLVTAVIAVLIGRRLIAD